jgi:hypothetical protein
MKIILTPEESEEYFYNALCNGLDYIESGYNLEMKYSSYQAQNALKKLKDSGANACYEDMIMQLLRDGHEINLYDTEGEEDHIIKLKDVHDKVQNAPTERILEMVNENDDAVTADVILQSVFFGEVIFG